MMPRKPRIREENGEELDALDMPEENVEEDQSVHSTLGQTTCPRPSMDVSESWWAGEVV